MTLLAALALSAVGAWAAEPAGPRVELGDTGWTIVAPSGYKAAPWKAAPNERQRGSLELTWASTGRGLDRVRPSEALQRVRAEINAVDWKTGRQPSTFGAGVCAPSKLTATPVPVRVWGRRGLSFECDSGEGRLVDQHFIVFLGAGDRAAPEAIHLSGRLEYRNGLDAAEVARDRTDRDFRSLTSSLRPKAGSETPSPVGMNLTLDELVPADAPPARMGGQWPWQVTPPEGFVQFGDRQWTRRWPRLVDEAIVLESQTAKLGPNGEWPTGCWGGLTPVETSLVVQGRPAKLERCLEAAGRYVDQRKLVILDGVYEVTGESRFVILTYSIRGPNGLVQPSEGLWERTWRSVHNYKDDPAPASGAAAGGAVPLLR